MLGYSAGSLHSCWSNISQNWEKSKLSVQLRVPQQLYSTWPYGISLNANIAQCLAKDLTGPPTPIPISGAPFSVQFLPPSYPVLQLLTTVAAPHSGVCFLHPGWCLLDSLPGALFCEVPPGRGVQLPDFLSLKGYNSAQLTV